MEGAADVHSSSGRQNDFRGYVWGGTYVEGSSPNHWYSIYVDTPLTFLIAYLLTEAAQCSNFTYGSQGHRVQAGVGSKLHTAGSI